MAKTFASIQQQIQKLQEQADAIRRKEAVGVIARIKTAIDAYGLTAADLFGDTPVAAAKRVGKTSKTSTSPKAAKATRKSVSAEKKAPKPPKFTDGSRFWSGHGKRPQWFKDAIEGGKTPQDLAVKPS